VVIRFDKDFIAIACARNQAVEIDGCLGARDVNDRHWAMTSKLADPVLRISLQGG